MSLPALYQLASQYRELEHILGTDEELDDTTLEAIRTTLDALEGTIEVKATNIGAYTLNLEAWAAAAKEASKKLAARATRIQRRADTMREYVRVHMAGVGIKKIEGPEFTLTRKLNPPAVVIDPETEIPKKYLQGPDPLIARIVSEAREVASRNTYEVIRVEDLPGIIEKCLPPREPDKKAIAVVLKAERDAWDAAVALAQKRDEPVPVSPATALPGCRLEQGERLDIKP